MSMKKNWFALLTKSNFENVVCERILQKNIEIFLPKIKTKSRQKNKTTMIDRPLFPGYLFVKSSPDPQTYLKILQTPGAVRLLGNKDNPVPVPATQIESLRILTKSDADIITGDSIKLTKGTPVMIMEGPMAGIKGIFIKYKGTQRVIIDIDSLQQFAGIEVNKESIEKV
ncbi:MAG: UpxY family transcription antiterminator, partial [Desulfobacteraceae bacterium]|nr:UpxY family transcription antiterminator [Desulfobacteraceae bacterium]